jgi:hypothetical protein
VDTGASFSIFPHRSPNKPGGPRLTGPEGQAIPCWGSQPMDLLFHGRRFGWTLLLADVQFPIIGVDFLRHFHLMVDPAANRLVDKRSSQELSTISSIASGVAGVKAPPRSPATARQAATCGQDSSQDGLLFVSAIPGPERFQRIVAQFPQVVNLQKSLPSPTTGVEHHIVTKGPPVSARFQRLDAEKLAAAKAEFLQLEKEGIVRRSASSWASPLHMVRKPDGSWRSCGDYRRLNLVMEPDAYPLPNMMDFTTRVAGCRVFSKIDLRKGYLQIPMHPADTQKTAITTPFGLFEFLRLPFGLRNAGNTFQRKMERVTGDLEYTFTYLEDLMVFSKTAEEHEKHLHHTLSRLQAHGLVLNFGASSVDFLGHQVSYQGVKPLPAYMESVNKFPEPAHIKDLQAFLGLVNFYRKFLPAIVSTLWPLTDSLKGNKKGTDQVCWTADMRSAFSAAKQALNKATLLAHPVAGATLALAVDTSNTHVGACLQQRRPQHNGWEPLGFFSKKLEKAQMAYSAFDRELLACVSGIKHFRFMLEGRPFRIYTDHKPLTFALSRTSEPWTVQQCRHLAYVAEFSSDIRHIKGTDNLVADALSRARLGGGEAGQRKGALRVAGRHRRCRPGTVQ